MEESFDELPVVRAGRQGQSECFARAIRIIQKCMDQKITFRLSRYLFRPAPRGQAQPLWLVELVDGRARSHGDSGFFLELFGRDLKP